MVAQALLAADVVNVLQLAIGPVTAGCGRCPLDGLPSIRLEWIPREISPTGYLLVDYRVVFVARILLARDAADHAARSRSD